MNMSSGKTHGAEEPLNKTITLAVSTTDEKEKGSAEKLLEECDSRHIFRVKVIRKCIELKPGTHDLRAPIEQVRRGAENKYLTREVTQWRPRL
jgi:hypothetical protein